LNERCDLPSLEIERVTCLLIGISLACQQNFLTVAQYFPSKINAKCNTMRDFRDKCWEKEKLPLGLLHYVGLLPESQYPERQWLVFKSGMEN
jgi:hypothetical protein